ncbi:hypothetical protein GGX14DRAFT_610632 [Mycena pura]|uniref:Uncharacterized protein n=1 Tax=Mycena pura TaxID=153505 RepID=A0AAD6VKI1_9AGAR|nr:hypothetical protein GGX14DRAFT_610632 [Mycena pura]
MHRRRSHTVRARAYAAAPERRPLPVHDCGRALQHSSLRVATTNTLSSGLRAGSIQTAGSDTVRTPSATPECPALTDTTRTASQLEAFFLAMTLHPDVRSAAQQDIKAIVGRGRLPKF